MIQSITKYALDIQQQNSRAISAVDKILEYTQDDRLTLKRYLTYNHIILQEIADTRNCLSQNYEAIVKFGYKEFIKRSSSLIEDFGLRKKDTLLYYSILSNDDFKKIHSNEIEPLISTFRSYEKQRIELKESFRQSSLVITAVPTEFRAVIRRLTLILDVQKVAYNSDRNMILRPEEDAFEFAFDKTKDEYIHVGAKDNDPHDRPFYLIVEGMITKNEFNTKVHVVLLPNYGHIKAGKAMEEVKQFNGTGIKYSEILIVGIAGGIDKDEKIQIGDLVISENIFGSETKKATPDVSITKIKERGKDLSFRSIHQHLEGKIDFDFTNWKPTLFEKLPKRKGNIKGFNSVFSQDYVSIDTLSKGKWFKEKLWKEFPTCKAIEMEAFGITTFVKEKNKSTPVKIIKCICDYGDYRKNKEWQPYCADVSASFLEDYLIKKYGKIIS